MMIEVKMFGGWTDRCGLSPAELARQLGVSVSSVYGLRNGHFLPGRALAVRIAAMSGGAVPVASWG